MALTEVLIAVVSAGALSQLISVLRSTFRHGAAQKALISNMRQQEDLVHQLAALREALETPDPTVETITKARQILAPAVDSLNEKDKSDILGTLEQGSEKSKANYIAKLVREAADL